jgi:hypothetical protein
MRGLKVENARQRIKVNAAWGNLGFTPIALIGRDGALCKEYLATNRQNEKWALVPCRPMLLHIYR